MKTLKITFISRFKTNLWECFTTVFIILLGFLPLPSLADCPIGVSGSQSIGITLFTPLIQTFTPLCDGDLTSFSVSGSSPGDVTISLEDGSGSEVFSQTLTLSGNVTLFPSSIMVSSSSTYSIVITGNGSIDFNPSGGYAGGELSLAGFNSNPILATADLSFSVDIEAAPLPIELSSFESKITNNGVELSWSSASELNNDGFEIQKSTDGVDWTNIGFVKGAGTTNIAQSYAFLDDAPVEGINYYRLKQLDFDGNFEYSHVVTANMNLKYLSGFKFIGIAPNPTKIEGRTYFTIDADEQNLPLTIQIFATNGQLLKEQENSLAYGKNTVEMDLSSLSSGTYFVRVKAYNNYESRKIIIE